MIIKIFGISPSKIEKKVATLVSCYKINSEFLDTTLEFEDNDDIRDRIYREYFDYIYADSDITLAEKLVEILVYYKNSISVAESLTGGNIASELVGIEGVSEVFYEAIVSYSNESKIARLQVPVEVIEKFGAVSAETAYHMVKNLSSDLCISTTGIAGPSGATATKKVGLVFVGIKFQERIQVYRFNFSGKRNDIRNLTKNFALFNAIKIAKGKIEDFTIN